MPMFASFSGNWSSQKKISSSPSLPSYTYWMASGSFGNLLSSSIVDSSGNIYLRNGPVVTKMDSIGTILWSYTYLSMSSSGSQPNMILDPSQDVIIAHTAAGSPYAGGITKISKTDGAVLWTRTTSSAVGTGWYNTNAVTADPAGNIYFICDDGIATGTFPDKSYMIVKFNNAGTWQWQRKINIGTVISTTLLTDLPSTIIANNSYVYFGGMVGNTSAAFYGALTAAGAFSWAKTHNGIKITGIALDSSGNVYFGDGGLNTNGILKYSATGTLAWQNKVTTSAGGAISGYAYLNIDASNNIYYMPAQTPLIIKYDTNGNIVWQRQITSTTKTFNQVANVATFPTATPSIFVEALTTSGGITAYGVLPSAGTTYAVGEWAITAPSPANLGAAYGKTITVRTPTVTTITPVVVTTAITKTLYTPTGIVITPLA